MQKLTNLIVDHPATSGIVVAVLIVVIGLFVYGLGDLLRFNFRRVWAIGGVVFRESIRRKVLWLTPLAMLGIVVLTGLQRPDDELDAIRQTIQFCLFASGLLVVVSGVMLACTNLPRDIESKVIFTIVTKPTTRFEIVLGKIVGFARVTGAILILMGLFTWGYLHARSWQLQRDITAKLAQPDVNEFVRGRLEHHQKLGLLATRTMREAGVREIVAKLPDADGIRWASAQQNLLVPFHTQPDELRAKGFTDESGQPITPGPGEAGLQIQLKTFAVQVGQVEHAPAAVRAPLLAASQPSGKYGDAEFRISLIDIASGNEIVPSQQLNNGQPIRMKIEESGRTRVIPIDPKVAPALANVREWGVLISPGNENFLIGLTADGNQLTVPGRTAEDVVNIAPGSGPDRKGAPLLARGNSGRAGQMLDGPRESVNAVALFHFDGPEPRASSEGTVALEMKMGIERLEDDAAQQTTQIRARVINRTTGKSSSPQVLTPENDRVIYADLPADTFKGGQFDVELQTLTRGHAVTLGDAAVSVVQARHSFAVNLGKALLSQWMLSVLVVTIGMFCSTFVSWPIAIVLSIVLLMGHWTVDQISDSLQPGIGALLATDLGASDAGQARVISATVDGLARMLNVVSQFLPNIDQFSTGELIERGLSIPLHALLDGTLVLALFGLPLLTMSYVILRNKEVAP